jgi:hypothetical protein
MGNLIIFIELYLSTFRIVVGLWFGLVWFGLVFDVLLCALCSVLCALCFVLYACFVCASVCFVCCSCRYV